MFFESVKYTVLYIHLTLIRCVLMVNRYIPSSQIAMFFREVGSQHPTKLVHLVLRPFIT